MNGRPPLRPSLAALASALLLAALLIGPALGAGQAQRLYMPLLHKPGTPPTATIPPRATATIGPTTTATRAPTSIPSATAGFVTATPTEAATATVTPTATSTTTPGDGRVGLRAQVSVIPMRREIATATGPAAYQIILDASGSMSYNFAGEGTINGRGVQCEIRNGITDPSYYRYPLASCQGGPFGYWSVESERRIYIAKQAVLDLIDELDSTDTMQIIKFNTTGNGPVDVNGDGRGDAKDWSSDKAALRQAVLMAGAYRNDPYLTEGGSTNAQALQKAREMWLSPSAPINTGNYRPVTIMVTDSVANIFLNGVRNRAEDICQDIYDAIEDQNLAQTVTLMTARCQIGYSTLYGQERPITASISVANALKRELPNIALYTLALAGMDPTGLDMISSSPSMTYLATTPPLVQASLEEINTLVENSGCVTIVGPWTSVIDSAHTPEGTGYPQGVFGYARLSTQGGQPVPDGQLSISHDSQSGLLNFSLPRERGVQPGVYRLEAHLFYKGNDGVTRKYEEMYDPNTGLGASSRLIEVTGGSEMIDPVYLQLGVESLCPE